MSNTIHFGNRTSHIHEMSIYTSKILRPIDVSTIIYDNIGDDIITNSTMLISNQRPFMHYQIVPVEKRHLVDRLVAK